MEGKKLRPNWQMGFFGFFAVFAIPGILNGEWIFALWLLWVVWFIYFIPIKINKNNK